MGESPISTLRGSPVQRVVEEELQWPETSMISESIGVGARTQPETSLTDFQQKVLSLCGIPFCLLGMFGSLVILRHVIFQTSKRKRTSYQRILVAMSVFDLIVTFSYTFLYFLVPKETSVRIWAVGNQTTCTILGYFLQLGFSAYLYNAVLSCYFLLVIRFGASKERVAQVYEPIMHAVAIGWPLISAIWCGILGVYHENELGPGCWINNYPENCGSGPYESGVPCRSKTIAYMAGGMPFLLSFIVILVNNVLIYCHVRKTVVRVQTRYPILPESATAFSQNDGSTTSLSFSRRSNLSTNDAQDERIQAVAVQGFLYVVSYWLTLLWPMIVRVLEGNGYGLEDEDDLFVLLVVLVTVTPLTGFTNMLVFLRPRYISIRTKDFPAESAWWACKRAMFGDSIQPTTESQRSQQRGHRLSKTARHRRGVTAPIDSHDHVLGGSECVSFNDNESTPPKNSRTILSIIREQALNSVNTTEQLELSGCMSSNKIIAHHL